MAICVAGNFQKSRFYIYIGPKNCKVNVRSCILIFIAMEKCVSKEDKTIFSVTIFYFHFDKRIHSYEFQKIISRSITRIGLEYLANVHNVRCQNKTLVVQVSFPMRVSREQCHNIVGA